MKDPEGGPAIRRLVNPIAWVISAAGSPYLVTVVTVTLVVLLLRPALNQLLLWGAICLVCGAGVPFLYVYLLWRQGRVSDMHVALREQREGPLASALASGAVGVGLLYLAHAPAELVALGAVYLVLGLVIVVVSRWWKISVHSAVLTAGILALALVGYPRALYALAAVPLVLWARLYRGKHTLAQGVVSALVAGVVPPLVYWATLAVLKRL